ncbi:MAG: DUF1501 domain-containing protein [Planctomycetota bacterium]|nr:DUF1501 domain-containing protein [Planctomycetota bacterium]MDA1211738.1 DUF1501 domain-containing protein [Planctomycetota bacterium]
MSLIIPKGMSRRHFLNHVATGVATFPALQFLSHLQANAQQVKKNQKACILMWMGGGPPTIDIWDLKPGSKNGGEFKPISTAGDLQISEHMPETAKVMNELSVVRSMSTREADHGRGRYFMHTSYVPNPTVVHPTFGSIASYELGEQRKDLEIPAFVSVGGPSESSGFLGMTNAPFVVSSNGQIQNASMGGVTEQRLNQRLTMLAEIESSFIKSKRGETPLSHKEVYSKAVNLMTSPQMEAFKVDQEKPEVKEAYGDNSFGQGLLLARRLVETGVPFVEVNMGGWDLHSGVFNALRTNQLPQLDRGIAALTNDLKQRGLLEHTVLVWMGEFARTPRINQDVGRDHWANSWSVMVGGGGLKGGQAIGETDADGTSVVGKSYVPGDIWSTVAHALGIPLDKVYTSKNGRPMKITNGGTAIAELIG